MPFDGYQRDYEDAQVAGRGDAYTGPRVAGRYILPTTKAELLELAASAPDTGPVFLMLDHRGERGMGERKIIVGWHRE